MTLIVYKQFKIHKHTHIHTNRHMYICNMLLFLNQIIFNKEILNKMTRNYLAGFTSKPSLLLFCSIFI